MVDERLLLTVPQMAETLAIGKTHAWAMVSRGEVSVIKIDRSTRVLKASVEEWVRGRALTRRE